jgi:citrate lyase beta subunit
MPIPRQAFEPDSEGPLRGVRVLDFSRLVAGNMLSLQLADFGAEVVKVESPGRGDTLRDWREQGVSVHWKVYARNKKSIGLDLKAPEAPGIILDLAAHFDVLIESFRYRYLERLGVGPDTLLERNPKLVVVRVSGFGQTGPYARRPGFGTLVEAMSGFASRNGFEDREPVLPPLAMADMIAGLSGAMATVIAVRNVEVNGGRGQVIDVSLLESIFSILGHQGAHPGRRRRLLRGGGGHRGARLRHRPVPGRPARPGARHRGGGARRRDGRGSHARGGAAPRRHAGPAAQPGAGGRPAQPRGLLPHRLLRRAHRRARRERRHLTMAIAHARRSALILPVNIPRFVEKAYTRGSDAIVLDLEDSVPAQEKASARRLVRESLAVAGRGGAEVLVRVNNDPALLADDIDAAVHPGLDGLSIPKAESAAQIGEIVARIARLEGDRGLAPGHLRLSLAVETPRGFLALQEIARSSDRIATMSIGVEDYCLGLGVEPSAEGIELLYPVAHLVAVCRASGIQPTGLVGSIAGFRDLAAFEAAAQRARQLGCEGAGCIHPDQVTVLNRVFSPDPARIEHARRVVEAFEDGVRRGTASVNLDGKMVDVPVYKRAQVVLARARAVAETERRKADALRKNG